jgi:hypothetical protein
MGINRGTRMIKATMFSVGVSLILFLMVYFTENINNKLINNKMNLKEID